MTMVETILDFTGVGEAGDFTVMKEGFVAAKCTSAVAGTNDKGHLFWALEWVVQSGQYAGTVIKDTLYTVGKDDSATKNLLSKWKMLYSRVLDVKLDGRVKLNPADFINRHAMLKIKQESFVSNNTGKDLWSSKLDFAPYYNIKDYSGAMDEQMKNSDAYTTFLATRPATTPATAIQPAIPTAGLAPVTEPAIPTATPKPVSGF